MSVKAMTWAWEQDLKPGLKFILVALADHSDGRGVCWPGHDLIAEKCSVSRQTVSENIGTLEAMNYLTIERTRAQKGRAGLVRYFLNLDRASKCPDGALPMSGKPTLESEIPMSGKPTLEIDSNVGSSPFPMSGLGDPYKEEPRAIEPKPPNPLSCSQEKTPEKAGLEILFERVFWPAYPKHVGKQDALVAWLHLAPDGDMLERITAAIALRKRVEVEARAKGEFVPAWPDPKRWLAKRRWEDVLPTAVAGSTGNNRPPCQACGKPAVSESEGKAWCRACNPHGREQYARAAH